MRQTIHEALAGARDMVGKVVESAAGEQQLGDDEVLARYVSQHRGQPWAIVNFAQREAGGGLAEALQYEGEMERMLRERGGQGVGSRE